MNVENVRQGSVVAERVSLMLRNGENGKALELLAQSYGPMAKNLMEQVMKYRNLSQDELVRVFGKISDILEYAADKMEKNERLNDKKEQIKTAVEQAEKTAELAAVQTAAAERQTRLQERLQSIDDIKRQIAAEKKKLENGHKREKDIRKRRLIEEKLKKLEERRKHLDEERHSLEKLRSENQNGPRSGTPDAANGNRDSAPISPNRENRRQTENKNFQTAVLCHTRHESR